MLTVACASKAPALGAAAISSVEHAGLQKAASVWATSLAQSPGVAKSIWPQGSDSSITWQINQLQAQVKTITDGYTNMLDNGLKTIMLDPNQFVHFADHGVFAVNNPLDAVDSLNATALALQTYLVSESLGQNKWYINPGRTSTYEEFDQDIPKKPACLPGPMGRCTQPKSVRPEWYWSPTTTRRYHFQVVHDDNTSPSTPEDMMSTIVNNNWTTLDILFNGAYECALNGNYAAGQVLKIDPTTNAIDTSCISHLPVKSVCGMGCAVEVPEGQTCPIDNDCDPKACMVSVHGGIGCGYTPPQPSQMGNSTPAAPPANQPSNGDKPCIAVPSRGGTPSCQTGTGPGSSSGSGSTATS